MTSRRQWMGAVMALATGLGTAACQPQAQTAALQPVTFTPVNGIGSIYFNAPIVPASRDLLIADMEGLINAGARTIRLAINSPGGQTDSARSIVDYITRTNATRGVTFETYSVGIVASAATYVFLSGQKRFARSNSGFLFHAAGMISNGAVSAERLREEAGKIDDYERAVRVLLKSRTRLTDAAIDVYLHRTVVLTADDAQRDGVADAIANFEAPPGAKVISIAARTVPSQPPATAAPISGR